MAIFTGHADVAGASVVIVPPAGQSGGIHAVRLSNYTGDLLTITNMNTDRPGTEYLMPFQQNVYSIENYRQPPSVVGHVFGSGFSTDRLLVEWSTEPDKDFPGTYPTALTIADINGGGASSQFQVFELAVPNDGATHTIPAQLGRDSLTFINDGTVALAWRYADTGWGTNDPGLAIGSGRTVNTTQAVYFRAGGAGGSVQWFATGDNLY